VANLAVLLAQPDTDHVVPVLDGPVLRAVLAIGKPERPVTPSDQRLMQDVANGAGMLLRGVQLNAELEERVRRADELAAELKASRLRLTQARDVERRRLITELGNVTTDRLATLREDLASAGKALAEPEPGDGAAAGPAAGASDKRDEDGEEPELTGAAAAQQAVVRARVRLDELLDRFRVIARGVYPAVLRDQGPYGALDELATDLPRPVRLTGNLPARLAWEVESGIYYLAASAMQQLAGQAGERALRVHLTHADARLAVEIDDPTPSTSIAELRNGLAHDAERLAALGGDLEVSEDDAGGARLRAWLPEQLEPYVDRFSSVGTRPGAP
jgi:signal transduction histidine kinase